MRTPENRNGTTIVHAERTDEENRVLQYFSVSKKVCNWYIFIKPQVQNFPEPDFCLCLKQKKEIVKKGM
jgi:hypothetical protein